MSLYYPDQKRIVSGERLVVCFITCLMVASFFAFPFYEADDMMDYVNSAYFCTAILGTYSSFLHTTSKTAAIFAFINGGMIVKSELKTIRDHASNFTGRRVKPKPLENSKEFLQFQNR